MTDSAEMPEYTHEKRKADHIRINLEEDVAFNRLTTGLENYHFLHNAIPEIGMSQIDCTLELFQKSISAPILISSMTGGTGSALQINRVLAEAAQARNIPMGLGSQRAAVEDDELASSYWVRDIAPDIPLFANLGAVQFNYGYRLDQCKRAVEMAAADALILHFNVLQEVVQPEGDDDFSKLLPKIEAVCRAIDVPVIAKEVGWGFSEQSARQLVDAGVSAIDVAGAGGTSWSQVEMYRAPTAIHRRVAGTFVDWGIPTADSIQYCRNVTDLPIFSTGGIYNGIDICKSIGLGANLGGLAGPFLKAAHTDGVQGVIDLIDALTAEIRIVMLCTGCKNLTELSQQTLLKK